MEEIFINPKPWSSASSIPQARRRVAFMPEYLGTVIQAPILTGFHVHSGSHARFLCTQTVAVASMFFFPTPDRTVWYPLPLLSNLFIVGPHLPSRNQATVRAGHSCNSNKPGSLSAWGCRQEGKAVCWKVCRRISTPPPPEEVLPHNAGS